MEKKWKIALSVALLIILVGAGLLAYFCVIVPRFYGNRYLSFSFQLIGSSIPDPHIDEGIVAVWPDGTIVQGLSTVGVDVEVINTYFLPVDIQYNGFKIVMLVYNGTVDDPTDIVSNKRHLVWGAYYGPASRNRPVSFQEEDACDFYVARKDNSNYTRTFRATERYRMFYDVMTEPVWGTQDLNHNRVPLGTYYIYCVAFTMVSKPLNLTIVSQPQGK